MFFLGFTEDPSFSHKMIKMRACMPATDASYYPLLSFTVISVGREEGVEGGKEGPYVERC